MTENPAVARARELVLAYGWNSTSFQIVNPGIKRWFSDDGEAVVGYVPAAGFRIVAGAPVCPKGELPKVIDAFESDACRFRQKVCYFSAESRLEERVREGNKHTKFLLGAQPTWDPHHWPEIVAGHKSLRAQFNRAKNKGVRVTEFDPRRAQADRRLDECLHQWLATKGLPPLHFLVEPETLNRLENRRIFVAEQLADIVGFITLSPVAERQGWLFEQFPHKPGAPNGTVELMIDTAMRSISADGCEYATLGLAPLSHRAEVELFHNPLWLDLVLAWIRKHGQRFYNFDGLDAFKASCARTGGSPYLLFPTNREYHFEHYMPSRLLSAGMLRFECCPEASSKRLPPRSDGSARELGDEYNYRIIFVACQAVFMAIAVCILVTTVCFGQNMSLKSNTLKVTFVDRDLDVSKLDDPVWNSSEPVAIDSYWSGEKAPADRQFTAQLLWSRSALFVRFTAVQDEPIVVADKPDLSKKSMGLWDRDVCEIFIAPDSKSPNKYFEFEVAPSGEWIDLGIEVLPDKRLTDSDYSSGMTSAARIEKGRVVMALRVDWKALGKTPTAGETWRGNLFRCVGKDPNRGYLAWQPTLTRTPSFHVPERFGFFTFAR